MSRELASNPVPADGICMPTIGSVVPAAVMIFAESLVNTKKFQSLDVDFRFFFFATQDDYLGVDM